MDITPEEAARTLAQVHETQRRVLRAAPPMFPAWYPVAVWIFVTGMQFVTEVPYAWWIWGVVAALWAGLTFAIIRFVREIKNAKVRPHSSVTDPRGWIGFMAWLLATIFASYALALWLTALGVAYPRTLAGVIMIVVAAITAPVLARWMSALTARRAETPKR